MIQGAHVIHQHSHFVVAELLLEFPRFRGEGVGNIHSKIINQHMIHVTYI